MQTIRNNSGFKMTEVWRRWFLLFGLAAGVLIGLNRPTRAMTFQSDMDALVKQSNYIFRGTVKKLNAVTLDLKPNSGMVDAPNSSFVVVSVDEALQAPDAFVHSTGVNITMKLKEPDSVKMGRQLIFFNSLTHFNAISTVGDGLAVIEVGRMEAPANSDTLRQQIASAKQRLADQDLQRRLAQAEMVIVGKITDIKQGPPSDIITEHDPDFWEAKLQIKSVELGPSTQRAVTMLYANSMDVVWARSPKFKKGQEGIWILHSDQAVDWKRRLRLPVESLTALDSEDFLPLNQLERVRRLLKKIR